MLPGSWLLLLAWILVPLAAAAEVETLNVDLAPLIEQAAKHRERTAVRLDFPVDDVAKLRTSLSSKDSTCQNC